MPKMVVLKQIPECSVVGKYECPECGRVVDWDHEELRTIGNPQCSYDDAELDFIGLFIKTDS